MQSASRGIGLASRCKAALITMSASYQIIEDYGIYIILVSSNIKCIMYNIIAYNSKQPIGSSHVYAKFKEEGSYKSLEKCQPMSPYEFVFDINV
jgi:hypothetical protein